MSRTTTRWLSAASDDGVALITVIGIMVVVTILAIGSFTLAEQSLFEATRTEDETRAFRAASSGLDTALSQFTGDPDDFPIEGSTPDGSYVIEMELGGGDGEYKLTSRGTGLDGSSERVVQQFYFLNLWKMNFAGTGPQSLITGTSGMAGTSNILGPFYMKGNFTVDTNMSMREGPLFVKGGNISVAAAGLLGEPDTMIKVFCDGTVPPNTDPPKNLNGVYIKSRSLSVPDIALPTLDDEQMQSYATKAQNESIDNIMGRMIDGVPPRVNLESVGSDPSTYVTMQPPSSAIWTRAKAHASNANYKFMSTSGDGTISARGAGSTSLTLGHTTFGSWGPIDVPGVSVAGDGHYVDPISGNPLVNRYDDFAYWNGYHAEGDLLFINGTVFVDGPLVFDDDVYYIGNGTIVANGPVTINGKLRPYGGNPASYSNTIGEENGWALGIVTPTNMVIDFNSSNAYANKTAEELRAGEPDIAGAFFSDSTVEFETTNIYIRGSIIAGKMDMGKSNAYLVTNPLLPEYLPDSLPGAEGGLLMPGMWTRN